MDSTICEPEVVLPSTLPLPAFISELSANHCGSLSTAVEMVHVSARIGCWAAKVQLFKPEQMTLFRRTEQFKLPNDSPWVGTYLWDLYEKVQTPLDWFPQLMAVGKEAGIAVMASVYHPDMVAFAEKHGNPIYKIASFEVGYIDLLKEVAKTGKLCIVSCGCATESELEQIYEILGPTGLVLFHCISAYPAKASEYALSRMNKLKKYTLVVGLSDHSLGFTASVVATAYGAYIIERHLTLRTDAPDASFSDTPTDFAMRIQLCRETKASLSDNNWKPATRYKRRMIDGHYVRSVS